MMIILMKSGYSTRFEMVINEIVLNRQS